MRETNTIAAEIVELSEIKSAYNHFLASHEGQLDVENTTYIRQNKAILSGNLRQLYMELSEVKSQITNTKHQITNDKYQTDENPQPDTRNLRMKFERYHATELEERAILLFNSDKRYKITE